MEQRSTRRSVPQRSCVACRQVKAKRELIRIVRTPAGAVEVDEQGKKAGRGAYLCRDRGCWEAGLKKNRLGHALRAGLGPKDLEGLWSYFQENIVPG